MTPEKVAVLVITGVIAVLLSITLMGSPDAGTPESGQAPRAAEPAPREMRPPPARLVPREEPRPVDLEVAKTGGYRTQLKPEPKTEPLTGGPVSANPPGTVGGGTYKILHNDTLAKIARKTYGRSSASDAIKDANPGLNPLKLRAGVEIKLPWLKPSGSVKAPESTSSPKKPTPANPKSWHLVAKGEKLETIARDRYGKPTDWTKIYAANRDVLTKPSSIRAGMKLRIP